MIIGGAGPRQDLLRYLGAADTPALARLPAAWAL